MLHGPAHPGVAGSELTRLLARLADAPFWSDHQRAFLREAIKSDADWSHVVDTLDMQLREPPELEMA